MEKKKRKSREPSGSVGQLIRLTEQARQQIRELLERAQVDSGYKPSIQSVVERAIELHHQLKCGEKN